MPKTTTATVHDIRTISSEPTHYHGWPTIARRRNGELLVVVSGNRQGHVDPFGRVELIRSSDNGKTWSAHEVLADGPLDDRDAGVLETHDGTLLVNWFTSLAWTRMIGEVDSGDRPPEKAPKDLPRWRDIDAKLDEATRKREIGVWMIRSEDGGKTWSQRIDTVVNSPHGPTQLSDGRLLYIGRTGTRDGTRPDNGSPFFKKTIAVSESRDDGRTWQWLADVPTADGDKAELYHEPYAVQAADGRIVAHIRCHDPECKQTIQCESHDGGKTWSAPRRIGVPGFPSHLLRLQDDRLLMAYLHRNEPWGIQVRVSDDHGDTWSEPIILLGEGPKRDLGYPSTAQLADGSLLTVWYERADGPTSNAVVRQAHWSLGE